MRRAGIQQVTIVGPVPSQGLEHLSEAEKLEVLLESVPDQKGWIPILARHFRVTSISELLMKLPVCGSAQAWGTRAVDHALVSDVRADTRLK